MIQIEIDLMARKIKDLNKENEELKERLKRKSLNSSKSLGHIEVNSSKHEKNLKIIRGQIQTLINGQAIEG